VIESPQAASMQSLHADGLVPSHDDVQPFEVESWQLT